MTAAQKVNLLGLTQPQMETFFTDLGEKRFRAAQLMKWIHHMGVDNFEEMTNIGKDLRAKLAEVAEITAPTIIEKQFSTDGTRKWVLDVGQGSYIETVLIPDGNRGTLCVSSQVGCALDCDFCSTGKQGFQRDLTVAEIVGQVWIANRSFGAPQNLGHHNITNVVMMGMGEPLLNFNNVVASLHVMKDDLGYGISKRRVTVSTSGVVPAIKRLAEEIDVSLAISLHAPNNELRNQLVPVNKKYPLEQLIPACADFLNSFDNTRRTITMEYVMLKEVNDKPEHAHELLALLKDLPVKMNLIPFNPFPHAPYERSSNNAIRRFQKILQDNGMITMVRTTRGEDIDAACGQLVGQVKDRTRRSKQWQATIYAEKQNQESSIGRPE